MQPAERRTDKNKIKNEPWRDPHAEAYVRIENITKRFGDFVAVNNVSLKIFKGEIFCLLGGSGCGKSTLLRMMAGFENPELPGLSTSTARTWRAFRRTSARST